MMGYHNNDGGFSYWGGESTPFYTALGLSIISRMEPHLVNVPKDLVANGVAYLDEMKRDGHWESLHGHGATAPRLVNNEATTAYVVNCLSQANVPVLDAFSWLVDRVDACKSDPAILSLVLESWGLVDGYKKAFPGLGETIKGYLMGSARKDDAGMSWDMGSSITGDVESTARVIIASSAAFPTDVHVLMAMQDAVKFLLSKRTGKGWMSTTDTLLASTAISKMSEKRPADFSVVVKSNGKIIKEESVNRENMSWKIHDLRGIYIDGLKEGQNDIEIEMTGEGKCHVNAEIDRYYHDAVMRDHERARVTSRFSTDVVSVGDKIELMIDVEPRKNPLESLMVRVPVPSLFRFNKVSLEAMEKQADKVMFGDNSVQIFSQNISEKKTIRIPLEAQFPGECRVDANAFEMYSDVAVSAVPLKVVVGAR
jgi:hypothetical protein